MIAAVEAAEAATSDEELLATLEQLFNPVAPSAQWWIGSKDDAPPEIGMLAGATRCRSWEHHGIALGAPGIYRSLRRSDVLEKLHSDAPKPGESVICSVGPSLWVRLPISVPADDEHTLPRATATPPQPRQSAERILDGNDRETRLAAVMLAWMVLENFYPYPEAMTESWDDLLQTALLAAAKDADARAFLGTLREFVAKLNDGHGGVYHQQMFAPAILPLTWAWAKVNGTPQLIITRTFPIDATGDAVILRPGDIVERLGDSPVNERFLQESAAISAATEQWRRQVALGRMLECPKVGPVELQIRGVDDTLRTISIQAIPVQQHVPNVATHPAPGSEVAPGVRYFDLNGASTAQLKKHLRKLQESDAVIFDARGYPGQAGYDLFQYIISKPTHSAWWCIPVARRPGREHWKWDESHWNLSPSKTRIPGKLVFITDGSAISYAESCMAIVEYERLGAIVGSPTAGTNGNVNPLKLPGGYTITWTGMKVEKHDRSPHHGVGVLPTHPVEPTREGIAAEKDELLERAIEVAREL